MNELFRRGAPAVLPLRPEGEVFAKVDNIRLVVVKDARHRIDIAEQGDHGAPGGRPRGQADHLPDGRIAPVFPVSNDAAEMIHA